MIRIDYSYCLKTHVKEHGFSATDIESPRMKEKAADFLRQHKEAPLACSQILYDTDSLQKIQSLYEKLKGRYTHVVVLGTGGSSLGFYALFTGLTHAMFNEVATDKDLPKIFRVDTVDPVFITELFEILPLTSTLFIVISKSGNTMDTIHPYMLAKEKMICEQLDYTKHFVCITSEGSLSTDSSKKNFLYHEAIKEKYPILLLPAALSGRFSVFSAVGLFPALFANIDVKNLLSGAKHMDTLCQNENIYDNPAVLLGVLHILAYQQGKNISVIMPYRESLKGFSAWYVQLFSESLGKATSDTPAFAPLGITPVKATGSSDQHAQLQLFLDGPYDKLVTFIKIKELKSLSSMEDESLKEVLFEKDRVSALFSAGLHNSQEALKEEGKINITIEIPQLNAYYFGQLLQLYMYTVVFIAHYFGVDPFSQPGVEKIKKQCNI